MAPTRNKSSRKHSSASPPRQRRRRHRFGPFGPYTAADHALDGLSRTEATVFNENRIAKALNELAKDTRTTTKHSRTHKMTQPQLSPGKTNKYDAGRWFQKCMEKDDERSPSCEYIMWATEPLDPSILFDSDIPGTYFHIRDELEAWDNGYPAAQRPRTTASTQKPKALRPFPSLSPLHHSPSPPPIASTSEVPAAQLDHTVIPVPGISLDKSLAATLIAWIDAAPVHPPSRVAFHPWPSQSANGMFRQVAGWLADLTLSRQHGPPS
ncbi:hypothetical protein BJ912DRAFT_1079680 [Pholiota molesta]|nr:hypothetical protein BJ912DRAFT_1079680 [Pholiota molesta]